MDNWTEIICILDRSGSMAGLEGDTIGGFNAFLERQRKEPGRARMTLVLFDDRIEVPWKHVDIEGEQALDADTYWVRGSTALLDAVGRTVNEVRGRIKTSHEAERPTGVVVLVITDGHENASQEYNWHQVRKLVDETQKDGWEYVFLGADIDAFEAAAQLSMATGSASQVVKSRTGFQEAYSKMNRAVSNVRRGRKKGDVSAALSDDESLF
jgi:hypothetical protein